MNIHIHHFQPGTVTDETALEQFQKQWATYQKLVDADALSHKTVGKILHDTLVGAFARPFSFLDIACGDSGQMSRSLAATTICHFQGVDLARAAPDDNFAPKKLGLVPSAGEVAVGASGEAQPGRRGPADAAWCGLSIHHLSTDGKRRLLKAIHDSSSSFVMVYEPTLASGENREGYLERFRRVNHPAWTLLAPEEWEQIDHHVTTSDLPESAVTWLDLGSEAGVSSAREIFCDPTGFYRVYRYDH